VCVCHPQTHRPQNACKVRISTPGNVHMLEHAYRQRSYIRVYSISGYIFGKKVSRSLLTALAGHEIKIHTFVHLEDMVFDIVCTSNAPHKLCNKMLHVHSLLEVIREDKVAFLASFRGGLFDFPLLFGASHYFYLNAGKGSTDFFFFKKLGNEDWVFAFKRQNKQNNSMCLSKIK